MTRNEAVTLEAAALRLFSMMLRLETAAAVNGGWTAEMRAIGREGARAHGLMRAEVNTALMGREVDKARARFLARSR